MSPHRTRTAVLIILALTGLATAKPASHEARVWADDLWQAALDGDRSQIELLFESPAADGINDAARDEFIADVRIWRAHETGDQQSTEARLAEARSEMFAEAEAGDLLESLRLLMEVQTLSPTLATPLSDPEIKQLLADAETQINQWHEEGKLLATQHGLLRLRAVYEDTGHHEEWQRLSDSFDEVANRVRMLRRYRFDDYHKRFVEFSKSRDQEVNEQYNPQLRTRWKQMVRDVDIETAARAIRIACEEHIGSEGYGPLLSGGIEAIRALSDATLLAETFESLGDADQLAAWNAALDATEAAIELPGAEISLPRTLQRIAQANRDTIELPDSVLWREFTDGAMTELDRFTQVIWPYDFESFQRTMRGRFVGVGVQIQETELGEIKVVTPLEGKPAFYAGVRADDIIAEVDGESTAGWTVQDAVHHITGPEDTTVELGVRREGADELVKIPVIRAVIQMPTVKGWRKEGVTDDGRSNWDWMIDQEGGIGYIKLTGFDQQTATDLQYAMRDMRERQVLNGLILDLRYNPGGLLDLAAFVSNLFVPRGEIVSGIDRNGNRTFSLPARSHGCLLGGIPTVVLINRGSASASEIVAGCLQAYEAAVVLGERSFGKGSVQTVHNIGDEARIKVTNQYYRLPSTDGLTAGRLVHKRPGASDWGVVPDLEVRMTPDDFEASERLRIRAERAASTIPLPPEAPRELEEGEAPNPADLGEPDIARLIEDGYDPQLELALLLVQAQVLAETADPASGDGQRVAEGAPEDLRSRAGGR